MDRKKFSGILDEAVGQLETEVRVLKNQQATLIINNQKLEKERNGLSQEIYELEKGKVKIISETQEEKGKILKLAQEKLNNATAKDIEASDKLSELNKKLKDADNLIKSNEGLQKNLNTQNETVKNIIITLNGLVELIKKTLENM